MMPHIVFCKTLTSTKQVIALANNNLVVADFVITPGRHLHPLFQPQHCSFTDADTGLEQEFLLSPSSNDPCFLHAKFISVNAAKMCACIVNADSNDIPRCFRSRPAFTVSNITITTALMDTMSPLARYKMVLLPTALPIPFGINTTTRGTVTEVTLDVLDTTFSGGAFWAHRFIVFNTTQYTELVHLSTNDGLGKVSTQLILPLLSVGQFWDTSPVN